MKVAYIIPRFPVLYSSFTLNQIRGAIHDGVDVRIFSLWEHSIPVTNERVTALAPRTRFFAEFFPGLQPKLARTVAKGLARVSRTWSGLNGRLFAPFLSRLDTGDDWAQYFPDLKWSALSLKRIADVLREENFNLIHGGFGGAPATAALALSKLSGIPFSFETHAFDLFVKFSRSKEKLAHAGRVFTISNYNKRYLIDTLGCPTEKVSVFRVPIDTGLCATVPTVERDSRLVVAACRLHPIKGLDTAIAAIDRVRRKFPDVRFEIYGDGPLRDSLENDIKRRNLGNNVTLLGGVANGVVLEAVARAAIFLLPSRIAEDGDRDGIPTAMIEAMYLGTPVVSSRVSGIPELVTDGVEGFLVATDDDLATSVAVERLLEEPELALRMGKDARLKVEREFNPGKVHEGLINGWSAMLGND